MDITIKKHATKISARYETFALRQKVYKNVITQMWSSALKTNDISIKFFSSHELGLQENAKILDAADK